MKKKPTKEVLDARNDYVHAVTASLIIVPSGTGWVNLAAISE